MTAEAAATLAIQGATVNGTDSQTIEVVALDLNVLDVTIVSPGPPDEFPRGGRFRVTVDVTNRGTEELRQGAVTLSFDGIDLNVAGNETQHFGSPLQPGGPGGSSGT